MANWWDDAPTVSPIDVALNAEGVTGKAAAFVRSIYQQESGGGRNTRTSNAGAVGGMQIIPATFAEVADKGWRIDDPIHNARAGVRYALQGLQAAGGDPALAGAYYYGGPGGLAKAQRGVAVSDPRNPGAPTTLQYGQQVAARMPKERGIVQRAVEAVIPSAQAAEAAPGADKWWESAPVVTEEAPAAPAADVPADVPRVEVRGTADGAQPLSVGERVAQGVRDPISGGAQLLTRVLPAGVVQAGNRINNALADAGVPLARLPEGGVDQQVREDEKRYQARRAAGGENGVDWARLGGNIVGTLPVAMATGGIAVPASLTGQVALGAGTAGLQGALTPVTSGAPEDFAKEKAKQIGISAAVGGVSQPIMNALGRLISPNASTNLENKLLEKEGVRQTIGQQLGGTANKVEQRLTSVPFVGDSITAARATAQDDLRRAAQNRVTAAIGGAPVKETGHAGMAAVKSQVDDAYDAARNAMGSFRIDRQGAQELQTVRQMVQSLDPKEQRQFGAVWGELKQDIQHGVIDSSVFKRVDAKLGQEAAKFGRAQDPYQQQLGTAFAELQRVIREAGARANPQAAAKFKAADEAFANFVRVQKAAVAAEAQGGQFTPGQLTQAVRAADQSARRGAVSTGDALMQDLSSAGNRLSTTVPNSGTVDRMAQLASGGALFANPLLTIGGGLAGAAAYSQPAQSALRALIGSRPASAEAIRNALLQASPSLAPAAGQIGLEMARRRNQ